MRPSLLLAWFTLAAVASIPAYADEGHVGLNISAARAGGATSIEWEGEAALALTDSDALVVRSEGESEDSVIEEAELHLLWRRALNSSWAAESGIRFDLQPEAVAFFALGLNGELFGIETTATLFAGEHGMVCARLHQHLELPLHAGFVLEPHLELNAHARAHDRHEAGAGASDIEAGLRLRYALAPHLAPYLDLVHERALGETAVQRRGEGERTNATALRAGLSLRF